MEEVRAAHNALTAAGLALERDPMRTDASGPWRDGDGNAVPRARLRDLLRDGETASGVTLANVLRRDRVTGKHLLPDDKETEHDTLTGVTSPYWAPRKGPEFTELVTRVFGGAPETVTAEPVKLGTSAPTGQAGEAQETSEAASPTEASQDTISSNPNEPEIEWQPDQRIYDGERKIKVKGPVRIKLQTNTAGIDGLTYHVDWQPLDKNGEVLPQFRGPDKPPKNQGQHVAPGFPKEKTFQPPYEHAHGFEVRIWIPPQQSPHANSGGAFLDVFVPKDGNIR